MRDFIFHDLDPAEKRILQLAEDVGYLILAEVTDRHHTEKLARIDFTPSDLGPFLVPVDPAGAEFPEAGELEGDDANEPSALGAVAGTATPQDLARAAYRWVKEQAGANMNGVRRCKFKLSVWGPKADKLLYCVRFSCEDPDWDAEEEGGEGEAPGGERKAPPMMPAPFPVQAQRTLVRPAGTPVPEGAAPARDKVAEAMLMLDAIPEGRVWMALGGAVAHHLHMMQEGYDNLAKHQTTILNTQNTQILRNQKVLEDLAGQVIHMRQNMAAEEREVRDDAAGAQVRQELGKQFISELGGLGRLVAAAKFGMDPELAEIANLVTASPELAEVIKLPSVKQMLRDEATRKELAELLRSASVLPETPPASPATPPANDPPAAEPEAA